MWLNKPQRGEGAGPQIWMGLMVKWAALSTVKLQRYTGIFSETFKLWIQSSSFLGTAPVERSSSYIWSSLRPVYAAVSLSSARKNCHWGPELSAVNFDEVLQIFKQKNRRIVLWFTFFNNIFCSALPFIIIIKKFWFLGGGGGGNSRATPPPPPPAFDSRPAVWSLVLYEALQPVCRFVCLLVCHTLNLKITINHWLGLRTDSGWWLKTFYCVNFWENTTLSASCWHKLLLRMFLITKSLRVLIISCSMQ